MELKSISEIPSPYHRLFEHYITFNAVQSRILDDLLRTDKSIVLQAPTGSGKTVAFELAIVRMLHAVRQSGERYLEIGVTDEQPQADPRSCKAIYVAPTKALCAEKFADWKQRFDRLNVDVQVLQVTGDSEVGDLLMLISAKQPQLVVTTPEKWHSLTLRCGECEQTMQSVRLFMLDEVHLLGDELRGPTLETLVTRMKIIQADRPMRLVVASATIPNTDDLAAWLGAIAHNVEADVTQLTFNDSQRPVPLQRHVIGYSSPLKGFQFDLSLNYKLVDVVRQYSEKRPTLVFCNSRKSTEMAASIMAKHCENIFSLRIEQQLQLAQLVKRMHDTKLQKLVGCGVGFHHAGLDCDDRKLIEQEFRNGQLMIVMATSTLATGVNLPAHLVVVKSTEAYNRGRMEEYAATTILQMIGRAGRPQYDAKGVAVIMTYTRNVRRYENLVGGGTAVESHLHKRLAEQLNSEIAHNTIGTLATAMNWLRATFFYVRALRSPLAYGMSAAASRAAVEQQLEAKCLAVIDELHAAKLIVRHDVLASKLEATPAGRLMAKYAVCFATMQLFQQVRGDASMLQLLNVLVRCQEFSEFTLRVGEKAALNALNDTPLRFPIPGGRIKQQEQKVLCLLQAVLGNVQIGAPGLAQEALRIIRIGDRLADCLWEYLYLLSTQPALRDHHHHQQQQQQQKQTLKERHLDGGGGDGDGTVRGNGVSSGGDGGGDGSRCCFYRALLHAVTIAKCFHARLWENSAFASKQLRKIGNVYAGLLVGAGKCTLQSIAQTDARTIEQLLKKASPFGDELLQNLLQTCPQFELQLHLVTPSPTPPTAAAVTVPEKPAAASSSTIALTATGAAELHIRLAQVNELYATKDVGVVLIVGDSLNHLLFYQANVMGLLLGHNVYELSLPIRWPEVEYISAHILHTTLVGVDVSAKIVLNAAPVSTDTGVGGTPSTTLPKKRKVRQTKLVAASKRPRCSNKSQLSRSAVATLDGSFLADLQQFAASARPKLSADKQPATDGYQSLLTAATCSKSDDSALLDETAKSDLIQTKVTKFFAQRKNLWTIVRAIESDNNNTNTIDNNKNNQNDSKSSQNNANNNENDGDNSHINNNCIDSKNGADEVEVEAMADAATGNGETVSEGDTTAAATAESEREDGRKATLIAQVDLATDVEEQSDEGPVQRAHCSPSIRSLAQRWSAPTSPEAFPIDNDFDESVVVSVSSQSAAALHHKQPSLAPIESSPFGFWNQTAVSGLNDDNENKLMCSVSVDHLNASVGEMAPAMALGCTEQVADEISASEHTQRFWYNVCVRFMRLQLHQQNFINFQKLYKCCCQMQQSLNAKAAQAAPDSVLDATFQSHVHQTAVVAAPALRQGKSHAAQRQPPSLRPQKEEQHRYRHQQPLRNTTVVPPLLNRKQRYRLQILPPHGAEQKLALDPDCGATDSKARPHISQINRGIMRHVLSQKLAQQQLPSPPTQPSALAPSSQLPDESKTMREIETQLLRMESEDAAEQPLNFEQLCRLYLGDSQHT